MNKPPLGDFSLETFLTDYWQKKPLLIRQALPGIEPPVTPDQLAGLACEEEVESRLIIHDTENDQWSLTDGPFTETNFSCLPKTHWTLLVQAVDHWVPAATDFLSQFYFIPSWRVDDLMISVSSDQGGVGPHYDNYDVFLVQVSGRRQWEVGGMFDDASAYRPDTSVKILTDWVPEQSWVLDPGDMLYVPPRVGHNGIAVGDDCMTCSVGFRAPSHQEILMNYPEYIAEQLSEDIRYTDPNLMSQSNPGQITSEAVQNLQEILTQYVDDQDNLTQWFGRYMTSPKYQDDEMTLDLHLLDDVRQHFSTGGKLIKNEGSRFAFQEQQKTAWLFVDGRQYILSRSATDFVKSLCSDRTFSEICGQSEEQDSLILDLLNHGSLYLSK